MTKKRKPGQPEAAGKLPLFITSRVYLRRQRSLRYNEI